MVLMRNARVGDAIALIFRPDDTDKHQDSLRSQQGAGKHAVGPAEKNYTYL